MEIGRTCSMQWTTRRDLALAQPVGSGWCPGRPSGVPSAPSRARLRRAPFSRGPQGRRGSGARGMKLTTAAQARRPTGAEPHRKDRGQTKLARRPGAPGTASMIPGRGTRPWRHRRVRAGPVRAVQREGHTGHRGRDLQRTGGQRRRDRRGVGGDQCHPGLGVAQREAGGDRRAGGQAEGSEEC